MLRVVGWGGWALRREAQRHQDASAKGAALVDEAERLDQQLGRQADKVDEAAERLQRMHDDLVAKVEDSANRAVAGAESASPSQSQAGSRR